MSKPIMPTWLTRHIVARRSRAHLPSGTRAGSLEAPREPEQLERIATYARAGYFNMGYTPDMFPFVGDLPPY
jgi:hypothetical protein